MGIVVIRYFNPRDRVYGEVLVAIAFDLVAIDLGQKATLREWSRFAFA
ncbi:MAG: hypothetical protein F6J90_18045 [Moorea sp. SIOASIH]|nr:hypothetical protein [Moorena sp. SIOASIH]NEO38128.1 hypothetical protein [Moorena sp. SIOASIH]